MRLEIEVRLPAREVLLSGVEPEGTLVAIRDGTYTLFLDHPGRRSVTLRFSADAREGKTSAPACRAIQSE